MWFQEVSSPNGILEPDHVSSRCGGTVLLMLRGMGASQGCRTRALAGLLTLGRLEWGTGRRFARAQDKSIT